MSEGGIRYDTARGDLYSSSSLQSLGQTAAAQARNASTQSANGINSAKLVSLFPDDNLKEILTYFFSHDLLQYKNFDYYYFVEH